MNWQENNITQRKIYFNKSANLQGNWQQKIIEDINVTFTKEKISISLLKLYKVKDCKNNSVVLDKKLMLYYNNTLEI